MAERANVPGHAWLPTRFSTSCSQSARKLFFLILGVPDDQAKEIASRYQYRAIEFKETAHRADGVFEPKEPSLPVYFLEVQFYNLPSVYADVLVKAYTYLKQHNPGQLFNAVVLFGSRSLEPAELSPYQPLLDAGFLRRVFLDEMPAPTGGPLGLAVVSLIGQPEDAAARTAKTLVGRVKMEIADESLRSHLIELIETVVMYKLPRLGREEIQSMLQIHDIRESRVYQEALAEGRQEGIENERQRTMKEKLAMVPKLAARQWPPEEIAEFLDLEIDVVRKAIQT